MSFARNGSRTESTVLLSRGGGARLWAGATHVMALGPILFLVPEESGDGVQGGGDFPDHCSSVFSGTGMVANRLILSDAITSVSRKNECTVKTETLPT